MLATLSLVDFDADAKPRLEEDDGLEDTAFFGAAFLGVALREDVLFDAPLLELLLRDADFFDAAFLDAPPREEELPLELLLRDADFLDAPPRDDFELPLDEPFFDPPRLEELFDAPRFEDLEDFEEPPRRDELLDEPFDEDLPPEDLLADFFFAFAMLMVLGRLINFILENYE